MKRVTLTPDGLEVYVAQGFPLAVSAAAHNRKIAALKALVSFGQELDRILQTRKVSVTDIGDALEQLDIDLHWLAARSHWPRERLRDGFLFLAADAILAAQQEGDLRTMTDQMPENRRQQNEADIKVMFESIWRRTSNADEFLQALNFYSWLTKTDCVRAFYAMYHEIPAAQGEGEDNE